MARNYALLSDKNGIELLPITTSDGVFCENGTKKLTNKLDELNQSIEDIKAESQKVDNVEFIIKSADWILNETVYEKQITHNLGSENLHVTARNSSTKEAITIGYKIIDKNSILVKSDEGNINASIILSAGYVKGIQTVSDDVISEVVKSRNGHASLHDRLVAIENIIDELTKNKISFSDFTETTIN